MSRSIIAVAVVLLAIGCAHTADGHRVRASTVRFDERSISGPNISYTLEVDGTWAGMGGDRHALEGSEIRKVAAGFDHTGALVRPSAGWGVELKPDCALVLFELQGRQVAGWAARKGAVYPEPRYPGRDALARLVAVRNEVWESPYRASP